MSHEHKWQVVKGIEAGHIAMTCSGDCHEDLSIAEYVELMERRCRKLEGAGDAIVRTLVRLVEHERIDGFGHQIRIEVDAWESVRGKSPHKPEEPTKEQVSLIELLIRFHGEWHDDRFLACLKELK